MAPYCLNKQWGSTNIVFGWRNHRAVKYFEFEYRTRATKIGARPTLGGYYNGMIDEVRIYNRCLTADEIKVQYNGYFGTGPAIITIQVQHSCADPGSSGVPLKRHYLYHPDRYESFLQFSADDHLHKRYLL